MKKIKYDGQEYSQAALATKLKTTSTTLRKYLSEANGDIDAVIKRLNERTYIYNGKEYTSMVKLSEATQIERRTLERLIDSNPDDTIDEIVSRHKENKIGYTYNGKKYSTIKSLAEALGKNKATVSKYLKLANNDVDKAMELYEDEQTLITIDGVRYYSQEQLAEYLGVSVTTLNKYTELEGSLKEAIELIKDNKEQNRYVWNKKEYTSLESLAVAMDIPRQTLKRILEKEADGDIEKAYKIYMKRNKGKYHGYSFEGKKYSSIRDALESLEISYSLYYKRYEEFHDFEKTIKNILKEREEKKKQKEDEQKGKVNQKETREFIYKGEKIYSIAELSRKTIIPESTLRNILNGKKKGNVDDIIDQYIQSKTNYEYQGLEFDSIKSLADQLHFKEQRLGRYIEKYGGNVEKAVFMIKNRDLKTARIKRDNSQVSTQDMAIILGMKHNELVTYLNNGMTIDEIQGLVRRTNSTNISTDNNSKSDTIMYDSTKSLAQYCIENKINYSCIYYAVTTYGKSIEEALEQYRKFGQRIPSTWIHQKYGILLKHLLLNEGINSKKVVTEMRNKVISLKEALDNYVIKDEAKKMGIDSDWLIELYFIFTADYISDEEKEEFRKEFYVSNNEEEAINNAKIRIQNIERKLLLYEMAECINENIYSEKEMIDLMKEYDITEEEVDVIFLELYSNFYKGIRIADDENLRKKRKLLNDYIKNWENIDDNEKIKLKEENITLWEFIESLSGKIAFYKNGLELKNLTGQDIGMIGYSANELECAKAANILSYAVKEIEEKEAK